MKKILKICLVLVLSVSIIFCSCFNASAFFVADDVAVGGLAIAGLCALTGVTLINATNNDVWNNMYSDLSKIANDTGNALYSSASAVIDYTIDYTTKFSQAEQGLIEVSGTQLSNAIQGIKNYFTAKAVDGAYSGITLQSGIGSLTASSLAEMENTVVVKTNDNLRASSTFTTFLANMRTLSKLAQYPTIYDSITLHPVSDYKVDLDILRNYTKSTVTFSNFTDFDIANFSGGVGYDISNLSFPFNGETKSGTLKIRYFSVEDYYYYLVNFIVENTIVGVACNRSMSYKSGELTKTSALPIAFVPVLISGKFAPCVTLLAQGGSSTRFKYDMSIPTSFKLFSSNQGAISEQNITSVGGSTSIMSSSKPYSYTYSVPSSYASDVVLSPSIPDTVISGQYGSVGQSIADRVGAVVGASDVIGLTVPSADVLSGQDVYNPSIDSLIGSGTLASDVVIDGVTVATGTDVITGVQTATADIATTATTDTVLDIDVPAPTPDIPVFPDVFPSIWHWFTDMTERGLEWFIFCKDVFTSLPTPIKSVFLGGVTAILGVGLIKKLLY